MEAPQHCHGSADTVATLYAHQTSDHPVSMSVFQLAARRHQSDPLGVTRREPAHDINLLQEEFLRASYGPLAVWLAASENFEVRRREVDLNQPPRHIQGRRSQSSPPTSSQRFVLQHRILKNLI
ncbi:hypothetical protein X777_09957 [Ooceraea biroi]|uniref:Uncharacterized protein n=1 Tax=Ooceraea biroi TaxID=2015173 RepID=A0A026W5C8_OOCBI|nr:hypothetical protein X777_09957 [Ooceraea biroi]